MHVSVLEQVALCHYGNPRAKSALHKHYVRERVHDVLPPCMHAYGHLFPQSAHLCAGMRTGGAGGGRASITGTGNLSHEVSIRSQSSWLNSSPTMPTFSPAMAAAGAAAVSAVPETALHGDVDFRARKQRYGAWRICNVVQKFSLEYLWMGSLRAMS